MRGTAQSEAAQAQQERYAWRVLGVTSLGVTLCFLNASTINVALPMVATDLRGSPAQASWIVLSYMLVITVAIPVFGRLADLHGRRPLYLLGLSVLTASSLGCGLARSVEWMLAFRCLQAVGAAAVVANTTALLSDAFPARRLGLGLGLNATVAAAAQSAGPIAGGALVTLLGWRAVFLLNLPLGLLALRIAATTLRATERPAPERFDGLGALMLAMGLGGLVYGLSMLGQHGWRDQHVLAGMTAAVSGLAAFVASQQFGEHPLIDLALFRNRERATAYATVLVYGMLQTSCVLLVALFQQGVQNQNALDAGLGVAPLPIGMMLGAPLAGRLVARYRGLSVSAVGLLACTAGLAVLIATLQPAVTRLVQGAGMLLMGIGSGLFLTANASGILTSVQPRRRGVANAVRATLANTGMVVGTALSLSIAVAQLSPSGQRAVYEGRLAQVSASDIRVFIEGCETAFIVLAALCVVGTVLLLSALRTAHPARRADSHHQPKGHQE